MSQTNNVLSTVGKSGVADCVVKMFNNYLLFIVGFLIVWQVRDFNIVSEKDIGFYAGYIGKEGIRAFCNVFSQLVCFQIIWIGWDFKK